jgi:nucleotide-binding universal stress UspA family protein
MPRTIVCGVDTSEGANAVAGTARRLADALDARLLLLHVSEEPQAEGEELLASIRTGLGLADEDVRLVEGSPADRLLEAVVQDGAELLVVGSRGRGSIRSALFGSVSRKLATDATCPVVIVPPESAVPEIGGGGSIVCGVDGSDHALAAARLAQDLASRTGSRLLLVHALAGLESYVAYPGARDTSPGPSAQPDTGERLAQDILDRAMEAVGGGATGVVESGLPWDVLEAVAAREDGRLQVVAARGLSAARAAVFGSVATKLATEASRPVVILPEPAEAGNAAGAG